MKRDNLVGLVFALSGFLVMLLSYFTRSGLSIARDMGKLVGGGFFLLGMMLFIWAVGFLREAFLGTVEPASNRLVQNGPYRWVRHPLYLSMIITLLGIGMALRSLWGMVGVFALFVPAVVYRARLEERALAEKFSSVWDDYVASTFFLVPMLW